MFVNVLAILFIIFVILVLNVFILFLDCYLFIFHIPIPHPKKISGVGLSSYL